MILDLKNYSYHKLLSSHFPVLSSHLFADSEPGEFSLIYILHVQDPRINSLQGKANKQRNKNKFTNLMIISAEKL